MIFEQVTPGYAALAVDSGDVPAEDSTLVSGVAIGENDITIGGSGKQTLWPKETLKEAADALEGQPLATDTDHTAEAPKAQTPVEAIAGEVVNSGYVDGVGVVFEAELDDESLADKVRNGRLEVSPLVSRDLEPLENGEAAFKATNINRWRDLALVANGAAPSNEITVGENPLTAEALHEALQELVPPEQAAENARRGLECVEEVDTDAGEAQGRDTARAIIDSVENNDPLSEEMVSEIASFDRHREQGNHTIDDEFEGSPCEDNGYVSWQLWGGDAGVDWAQNKNESMAESQGTDNGTEIPNAEALKTVAGVTFEDTATGELDESEIPNEGYESHYLYPEDTKTESGYPVVDAEGNLRKGNVDAAWSLGARGRASEDGHDSRLMELAQEFENPPEWAMDDAESMADMADLSNGDLVRWNSGGDRDAFGMVEDTISEGQFDDEIDGDVTVEAPAALITVHTPGDDGWEETEQQVAHKPDTLEIIDELPDPESLAKHEENMASVPDSLKFDNPGEAMSKAQDMGFEEIHSHGEGESTIFMPGPTHEDLLSELETQSDDGAQESMSQSSVVADSKLTMDNITDTDVAVLEAAESLDEPVEALEEFAATEQPTVVNGETFESMRGVLEEALNEKADLKESTIEALSFGALVSEFQNDDGELVAEALVQNPETSQPEDNGEEALSEDADVEKAEALYQDYQSLGLGGEGIKDDIVEALGVSDFDEAKEVLN
jgi:hypothetical protein